MSSAITRVSALSEAIWLGRTNKEVAFKVLRKYFSLTTLRAAWNR